MHRAICTLEGIGPYQQSKQYDESTVPKKGEEGKEESHDEYEKRTWWNRAHMNEKGNMIIPAAQFKQCIMAAAKYRSEKIPDTRGKTFTQKFVSGISVPEGIELPIKVNKDMPGRWVYANARGMRNGPGAHVWKCFPTADKWKGEVTFIVLDEIINEDVFMRHIVDAGSFIGIGTWRPQNGGDHGRFMVVKMDWLG